MKRNIFALISILLGIILFFLLLPLQFDVYIPVFHSVISIVITASTIVLFSFAIYKLLRKTVLQYSTIIFYFSVILGMSHGFYSLLFWSSWICLGIIFVVLIILLCCLFDKKRNR